MEPRKYRKDPESGEKLYLDAKQDVPPLSDKAKLFEDVLKGIATKIGGDHTTDLARLMRLPGTLNRKDQRNGKEPKPSTLVKCDPEQRYALEESRKYAAESPDRKRREHLAKVKRLCTAWGLSGDWSSHLAKETVEFLRVDAPELWERPPIDKVNVKNGLLRVADRKLLTHDPTHLPPVQLTVKFDPNATCPNVRRQLVLPSQRQLERP